MAKTCRRCRAEDVFDLGAVARQRLLDEDVLPGIDGQQGVLPVAGVRGGDVDRLDLVVGHQVLVAAVGPGHAVAFREVGRPAGVPRADRDHGPGRELATASASLLAMPPGAMIPQFSGGASLRSGTASGMSRVCR